MTREEAIRVLEDNRPSVIFEDEDAQKQMAELCQAIDLAIEALSRIVDLISRADAIEAVHEYFRAQLAESDGEWNDELQEYVFSKEDKRLLEYNKGVNTALKALPSADAEQGYTEWLEKIIVDNEGANEWLCEDTPDLEWCAMNCHYSSIQAECLRHLYAISKGGDTE